MTLRDWNKDLSRTEYVRAVATSAGSGSFSDVAVSGQPTVTALTTPILTVVAGTNVTLTTDATAGSLTINSSGGGAGGAPTTADYLVRTTNASLSAERVVTDSTSITADWATAGQVAFQRAALTGDVTASANSNATTIANNAVTYAKIQDVSATDRLLGRSTAGAGDIEEIACTSAGRALLDDADASAQRTTLGLGTAATQASSAFAAASHTHAAADITSGTIATARLGSGTADATTYLRGDQTWATVSGSGLTNAITEFTVVGQDPITAAGSQSVQLIASTNVAITTDAAGKTITFATENLKTSPVKFADAPINAVNAASVTLVDLVSKTVTVTAGDTIEIELEGTILNNSGAVRTYTFEAELGAFGITCLDGTTVAASATTRAPITLRAVFAVKNSSTAAGTVVAQRAAPGAADSGLSIATTTYRHAWHTSASNLTGSQAIKLRVLSSAATATQTFTVFSYRITQHPQAI